MTDMLQVLHREVRRNNRLWYPVVAAFAILLGLELAEFGETVLFLVGATGVLLWVLPFPGRLTVLLCAGFLLGGRVFAFLMWPGLGLPLFVTEAVTAIMVGLLILSYLMRPSSATFQRNTADIRLPAMVFWGIGTLVLLTSVWHCLQGGGQLVPTLRNAALFYYSIFYLFVLATLDDVRLALRVSNWFSAIIVFMSLRYLVEHSGMFPNLPGTDANFFCVVAPIAVSLLFCVLPVMPHKRATVLCVVLISTAVVFTDVRQGLLGLICGWLCSCWLLFRYRLMIGIQRKTIFIFLSLFAVTVLMLATRAWHDFHVPIWDHMIARDFSDTGRRVMWAAFLEDSFQSWETVVFGVGFDRLFVPDWMFVFQTVDILTNTTTGALQLDPHNSHLHLFYRVGLIGFVAYLLLIQRAFAVSFRYLRHGQDTRVKYYVVGFLSALASIAGQAFVGVLFEAPHRGIPFWVVLGVATCVPLIALADEKRATGDGRSG